MGCSNPHPHGQIWAMDTLPNEAVKEAAQQQAWFDAHQTTLLEVYRAEEEAMAEYGAEAVVVHRARFRSMARALPASGSRCLLKLVIQTSTDRVLGCHMVGEHAAEIIQMAAIAIGMGATKADFDRTMALHPSVSEEFVTMG